MKYLVIIFFLFAQVLTAQEAAAPDILDSLKKARSVRDIQAVVFYSVKNDRIDDAISDIDKYLLLLDPKNSMHLSRAQVIFDYGKLLKLAKSSSSTLEFIKWLSDPKRFGKYIYTLADKDDVSKSFEIMKTLYEHDPKERDKFFNLMVAMSVVWDQKRRWIHHQMGPKKLDYSPEITSRYDYFKMTYSKKVKMSYSRLSIQDLIFVVDTPVPITELEWAKENVRSSVSRWGSLYPSIIYNHKRLNSGQYSWIHGDYKLEDIKEFGGICVDQAYYTIMTARANGIPAMYFHGVGRNAGERHAWAGHMISTNKWNLEVGRYSQHNYVTGFAMDPQTNSEMTDHLLDFKCSGEFSKDTFYVCKRLTEMAEFYKEAKEGEKAFISASQALRKNNLYLPAWGLVENYYLEKKDHIRLVYTLKSKMSAFKKYPDFAYDIGQKAIEILEEIGKEREAEALADLMEKSIKTREDLSETFVKDKVKSLYESKKADEGLKLYEKYLSKQKNMYDQIEADIQLYLKYTKENGQTKRAPTFLRRFLRGSRYNTLKKYLAQAYRNNGDESRASKIK